MGSGSYYLFVRVGVSMLSSVRKPLDVLRGITKAILSATTEEELLEEVCRIFVVTGGYRMCWIGRAEYDAKKSVLPIAQYGAEDGYLETVAVTWDDVERGHGPSGTAIRDRKPAVCQNIETSDAFLPWRAEALLRSYASSIAIPIIIGTRVFGAISLYSVNAGDFGTEQVDILADLVRDLGDGIKNIHLRVEQERVRTDTELRELRATQSRIAINALLKSAVTKMSMERQLEFALNVLLKLPWIAVEQKGVVFLFNQEDKTLDMISHQNIHTSLQTQCKKVALGQCLCGRAAEARTMLFFPHFDERHEITYNGIHAHGHYCIPIMSKDELLGLITLYVKDGYVPDKDEEAFFVIIANTLANLIEFRRIEYILQDEKDFSKIILDVTKTLILVVDTHGRVVIFNKTCQATTGYTEEEVIGNQLWDFLLVPEERQDVQGALEGLSAQHLENHHESFLVTKQGATRLIEWHNRFVEWNRLSTHERFKSKFIICTGVDITERKVADEKLKHIATHDPLTGLLNRSSFMEFLNQKASLLRDNQQVEFSLMFIDLDGFSEVNDTFGHAAGDFLLVEIGRRIQSHLRKGSDVVARIGGDEFAIVFDGVTGNNIRIVADRLIKSIAAPVVSGENSYHVSASVGISFFPLHSSEPETLMILADNAMYDVKKAHKNGFSVYEGPPDINISL